MKQKTKVRQTIEVEPVELSNQQLAIIEHLVAGQLKNEAAANVGITPPVYRAGIDNRHLWLR